MKKALLMTALLSALLLTATSCNGKEPATDPDVATTNADTLSDSISETDDVTADPETVAPEADVTETDSASGTQAESLPETVPETLPTTESETSPEPETQPETIPETEPVILPDGLYVVGKSYDGRYACYNGSYDFGFTVCSADGQSFSSVQACVDYLASCGGGDIMIKTDLDICLAVDIPDDGNIYKIYYNNYNCDFVFNHGFIYDDSIVYADVDVIPGLAYYSSLSELDAIGGLENTGVWVCSSDHEALEKGRYAMLAKEEGDTTNYHYEKYSGMDAWYGLMDGEILPEA